MKVKKLLAGILSATMVLGTMVVPAFASGNQVTTSDEFKTALSDNNVSEIVLANDVAVVSENNPYNPEIYQINRECVIDLGGHTLDLTGIRAIWAYNNVTVKNGKIVFGQVNDALFHVGNWEANATGAILNLDGLEFEQVGTPTNTYFLAFDAVDGTMNINNCVIENIKSEYGLISDNSAGTAVTNINDSVVTSESRVFQNGTYVVSGKSTVSGSTAGNVTTWTVGNNVTISGVSSNKAAALSAGTYYGTLADAVENAADGATITLLSDVTESTAELQFEKDVTIDLNGHTWNFDYAGVYAINLSKSLTIKNGTINLNGVSTSGAFYNLKNGAVLRLDNVNVVGEMRDAGAGVVFCEPGSSADLYILNNSSVNLKANSTGRLANNVKATVENSNVTLENFDGGFASTKLTVKGNSVITVKNSNHALSKSELEMNNTSKLIVTGCTEAGIKLDNGSKVILNDASTVSMSNNTADFVYRTGVDPTAVNVEIAVAKDATLDAKLPETVTENATVTGKALAISVEFEATETPKEYNIVLTSTDRKNINRFTSAQLKFSKGNDEIGYVITGANENITVNEQGDDIYLFNLKDGESIVADSYKIVIGKVVFDGYSDNAVDFKVNAEYDNKVTATKGQNITDAFTVENDKLTINDEVKGIINDVFEEPKCEVTINVAMNEPVTDNKAAYQKMQVVISGQDLSQPMTFDLGTDIKAQSNNNYQVTATLKQDKKYVITVTGEGYRKAQYTLRTNEKETATVNFWNNVQKPNYALEMETGNTESKAFSNFIAGDIVKDTKLNIYDLSAVVSYFGAKPTADERENGWSKVKYDLDRNGVIDSTDVSIVLNAWRGLNDLEEANR